jgi:hypothetical protein
MIYNEASGCLWMVKDGDGARHRWCVKVQ